MAPVWEQCFTDFFYFTVPKRNYYFYKFKQTKKKASHIKGSEKEQSRSPLFSWWHTKSSNNIQKLCLFIRAAKPNTLPETFRKLFESLPVSLLFLQNTSPLQAFPFSTHKLSWYHLPLLSPRNHSRGIFKMGQSSQLWTNGTFHHLSPNAFKVSSRISQTFLAAAAPVHTMCVITERTRCGI